MVSEPIFLLLLFHRCISLSDINRIMSLLFNIDQNTITHLPVVIWSVIGFIYFCFYFLVFLLKNNIITCNLNEFVLIRLSLILLIKRACSHTHSKNWKIIVIIICMSIDGGAWTHLKIKIIMKKMRFFFFLRLQQLNSDIKLKQMEWIFFRSWSLWVKGLQLPAPKKELDSKVRRRKK